MSQSDETRIRELSESIRAKCLQAQQSRQQTTPTSGVALTQNSEVRSRLKEVIFRLQEGIQAHTIDPTLSGVQQRLQYTASKFGLTYSNQRGTNNSLICCYLSSESFYIEICLDDNGQMQSANVVLGQETQKNTQLLSKLLQQHKYEEFEKHVKSLVDMFSQATGQEVSLLLLRVIFAMENILLSINNSSKMSMVERIMLDHLGQVTPRKAGLPMKLTFFVTPLEALRLETSNEGDLATDVGVSAEVQVERSTQLYRLPVDPNLFNRSQSSFNNITEQNTVSVPLTLVLCLSKDIPVCASITEQLQQTMYGSVQSLPPLTAPHVDQLIIMEGRKKDTLDTATHVIYLPGQVHEYTGIGEQTRDVPNSHRGVLLPNRKVPFTHPMHVIKIIRLLRQQLVYNNLLRSCLERKKNASSLATASDLIQLQDYSFHVTTQPPESIAVTMRLLSSKGGIVPLKIEFMIPLDNGSPTQPVVRLHINESIEQSGILNRVLTKCMSIPITLHSIFSNSSQILPPNVAAVIKDHQDTLTQFSHELKSCDKLLKSCDNNMEVQLQTSREQAALGNKRKRM